ncbi:MAG: ABC transporter substrate-binding protein [Rhodospirillaceae bacterium]|jgi:microcin C transport system substrate-binding protein|nr:ABC transporter substrate-binding protein [Rhodospirillaceae bacterium]MBT5244932.1 ABC transporter substrate-binding protein [Rhodospirillaceae bacterium]MBT5562677.1 ABC transporter substrate-binding protein [Rhodospirillaceae bacterium]MBT6243013.1 ABC transporter substrate-binding protein [Rhodospirillaceae bacterium]MBT7136860.1 ABC transporter substrate-binding protein [Rhodospirillaceae bacterium]
MFFCQQSGAPNVNRLFIVLLTATFVLTGAATAMAEPRHGLAMHGEPKYGPDFKHFDYVNPDAPKGGKVKLGSTGSFDNLNGFIVKGEAADGLGAMYDTLMTGSADEAFTEYGLLAESIEVPEDRTWVQFVLRKEARWHDGKPVTADDVIWTFNTLLEKGTPRYRYYYADVVGAKKIDERTVRFDFKNGENRELPMIMGQLVVLPKHYWQDKDFTKTTLEPPLGSGPYRVESLEAGRDISYRRVENYWGRDLPVNVGRDNFDVITYDYYRDATVQVEAFKAGAFDFRAENISKVWATSYDIPAVKKGLIKKIEVKHNRTAGIQGFVYNTRREIFKDPKLRQALAYGFDFAWSNRNLFYGQYTRTRSYFDNSELAATGLPGKEELEILEPYRGRIADDVFTTEYQPPKTKGDGRIRSNLRIGDRLLKEAGWVIKDNLRVNEKTGRVLEFEILLVSPAFERIVLPFAKNLERLGVKTSVRTVDSAQYLRRLETFDYDMLTFIWGQSLSPGNEQLGYWGSGAASQNGSRNFIGISDPVVDDLIAGLISAPDRESLITRTRALDRVLQWGHYLIPHWHLDYDRLIFWNKFERPKVTPISGAQFNTWWINPNAEKATVDGLKSLKSE